MSQKARATKIIFTVGPATESLEMLQQLIEAGADVCRFNMAHASHEWTLDIIKRVREAGRLAGRTIPIMMDIKGPEIRTGDLEADVQLEKDQEFDFLFGTHSKPNDKEGVGSVTVNYPDLGKDLKVGDTMLVDSGLIRLEVTELLNDRVRARVVIPGPLSNRRHINLPGVKVNLPALTDKDRDDIAVGIEGKVEFFALSFVRDAADVRALRKHLEELGSTARIIAKIEDQTAIGKLHSIIRACDGLMVARGDLGIECPFEQLPNIQKRAVKLATNLGRPVIVATNMLESMIENPVPTRAEITDVSNAVFEQADAIMLSGETTKGKYPLECVQTMDRIARECEKHLPEGYNSERVLTTPRVKILRSATQLAHELDDAALLIFTRHGNLPRILASLRPVGSPIFAFTETEAVFCQLSINWGVTPFCMPFDKEQEATIQSAINVLLIGGWVNPEQWLVVITNNEVTGGSVESLQMRQAYLDGLSF